MKLTYILFLINLRNYSNLNILFILKSRKHKNGNAFLSINPCISGNISIYKPEHKKII